MNKDVNAGIKVLVFGFIGIILAAILYLMNQGGVIVDEFVTESATITIVDTMAFVIIFFLILGVAYAALSS